MKKRYFLWNDDSGHKYAVPCELEAMINKLENELMTVDPHFYDKAADFWDAEIEPHVLRVEGYFTFSEPCVDKEEEK